MKTSNSRTPLQSIGNKSLAQEKLETIMKQITELKGTVELLQTLIQQCDTDENQGKCALYETLHEGKCNKCQE